MATNSTNYVFLNTAASCAPTSNTTGFTPTSIPLALVYTSGSAITLITDARTPFERVIRRSSRLQRDELRGRWQRLTDDTAAIDSVISIFCQNLVSTGLSGIIYFPPGNDKTTSPLVIGQLTSGNVILQGVKGGSILSYQGSATTSMVIMYGVGNGGGPIIDGLEFNTNGKTSYAVHLVADNAISTTLGTAVSPGSNTVTPGTMSSIGIGTLLKIDSGASAELVYVTAGNSTTFTATFAKAHSSSASVGGGSLYALRDFQE